MVFKEYVYLFSDGEKPPGKRKDKDHKKKKEVQNTLQLPSPNLEPQSTVSFRKISDTFLGRFNPNTINKFKNFVSSVFITIIFCVNMKEGRLYKNIDI